jgi:hypothetical protein
VSVVYLDIVDYLAIAAEVTGLDIDTVSRVAQLNLADSALHAPAASWGDEEFYPRTLLIRQRYLLSVWRGTTPYRTATSGRPGWH